MILFQAFHPCLSHFWWACTTTPSWPGSCGIFSIPSKTLCLGASVPSIRTGQVRPLALHQRHAIDSDLSTAFSHHAAPGRPCPSQAWWKSVLGAALWTTSGTERPSTRPLPLTSQGVYSGGSCWRSWLRGLCFMFAASAG